MSYYVGLDLGGTNLKAGLVDGEGGVVRRRSTPTRSDEGPGAVIEDLAEAARAVAAEAAIPFGEIRAIGVGAPGPLDFEAGIVAHAPNLPGWENVPLRDRLSEATSRPVLLENDANAAAFGEYWAGTGAGPAITHLALLTLGTGVGSGFVIDGELLHGGHGAGAEAGHMIVHPGGRPCGCGQRGCLEAYAAASQIAARVRESVSAGEASSIATDSPVTAETVFAAKGDGDALAERVVEDATEALGIAAVNLCRLFDPQMIVLAGGMAAAGAPLFQGVRAAVEAHTWQLTEHRTRIEPSALGGDAGIVGAAAAACDAERRGRL